MQVKQISSEKLKREYNITVPAKDITDQIKQRLVALGKNVKIPGFRPGKVPVDVLQKQYGQRVLGEVLDNVIEQTSRKALVDEGVRPALQPKVELVGEFEEGKDLVYKIELEILPEVPEVDYSKISIERPVAEITDKEVDEAIDRIANEVKTFEKVDRKAKNGDAVVIDFKGFLGEEAFAGGEAQGHTLELGSNSFIPGFEDQLVGAAAGEDKTVTVTFPEAYHSPDLAGQEARFEVKVHEVQKAAKQAINDELASKLGFESLDKLKEALRKQLEREVESASRTRAKKALFDTLNDSYNFETPEGMTQGEFDSVWQQVQRAKEEEPDSEEFKGKSDKELKAEYEKMAQRRVRLGILLAEIGRKEKIQVNQEEINNALIAEARQYPGQEQKVLEHYQQHPEQVEALKGPILEEKVVDFILEKVTVKDVSVTLDELQKFE